MLLLNPASLFIQILVFLNIVYISQKSLWGILRKPLVWTCSLQVKNMSANQKSMDSIFTEPIHPNTATLIFEEMNTKDGPHMKENWCNFKIHEIKKKN